MIFRVIIPLLLLAGVGWTLVSLTRSRHSARMEASKYKEAFEKAQDGLLMIESKSSDGYASNLASVYKSEARQIVGLHNEL